MKILFLGDIVGKAGRLVVQEHLDTIKKAYNIDFVIANGENAAHGKGITSRIYRFFKDLGIDVITMGNHTFSKKELLDEIEELPDLIRPMNLSPIEPGQPYLIKCINGKSICVINLCGQVFMSNIEMSPFKCMEQIFTSVKADMYFVDFHAETTSEKVLFGQYFKDKCVAVVGTHTHIQTADERIIDGCAYITDVGMCGVYNSVLGRDLTEVIDREINHVDTKYTVAEGPAILCGVIIEIDEITLRAKSIERIQIRPF